MVKTTHLVDFSKSFRKNRNREKDLNLLSNIKLYYSISTTLYHFSNQISTLDWRNLGINPKNHVPGQLSGKWSRSRQLTQVQEFESFTIIQEFQPPNKCWRIITKSRSFNGIISSRKCIVILSFSGAAHHITICDASVKTPGEINIADFRRFFVQQKPGAPCGTTSCFPTPTKS